MNLAFIKSPKFLIFLIVFINFLGYGIVFPLLPLLTEQYGGDPFISGILIASFSLMQLFAMPIMGRLSDRFGRRPLLLFSLWGTVVSFFIMGATHSILWLLIARIIDGISGGNLSIAQAYIADITKEKERTGGMGIIAAGISLGFILGPIWGAAFSAISLGAPFFAAAVITFISIVLAQFFLPESVSKKEFTYERHHFHFVHFLRSFFKPSLLFLNTSFLLLFWAQSGVFTTFSLFGKDVLHIDLFQISLLFAFGGILSAIIQGFVVGRTVKYISERKLYIYSSIVAIVGFAVLAKAESIFLFFLGSLIFSIGNSFFAPVVQALVSEKSSPHEQGGNMGILQSFGSIGRIFGPLLGGFVYEKVSPFSPAVMGAVVFVIILSLGFSINSQTSD